MPAMTLAFWLVFLGGATFSPMETTARAEWAVLRYQWGLAPLSIIVSDRPGAGFYGFDDEGRAIVGLNRWYGPAQPDTIRFIIAHESLHSMMWGHWPLPRIQEEALADDFAWCVVHAGVTYPREPDCPAVLARVRSLR